MKSGFPGNGPCLRQPLIPWARNIDASFNSVSLLPFDRMAAMTCERFRFDKTSAIDSPTQFTGIISLLNVARKVKGVVDSSLRKAEIRPVWPIAGMSAVLRWALGRDTGDLPIMERSEMTRNLVGTRGRAVRTSGGRVRRGLSPGGWRAGVRPAACLDRPEVGLILGAL